MRILIVSAKYAPVHNSLCRAIGEPLRAQGNEISYLLPESARWLVPESQLDHSYFIGNSQNPSQVFMDTIAAWSYRRSLYNKMLRRLQPNLVIFESVHPLNELLARECASLVPSPRLWLLFHEPYVQEKWKHGGLRQFVISMHELVAKRLLPLLDGVLLPSKEAELQMQDAYSDFEGSLVRLPLLFEDRSKVQPLERRYFSFIGSAVPAKGINQFMELIEISVDSGNAWEFQIATSSELSRYLTNLSPLARKRLRVISKMQLCDEDIDRAIRSSWAILAPYRRVTQSGVIPVAFMHGTPVISTNSGGMPEFVIPGETGYLVSQDCAFSEWEAYFQLVQLNFERLSETCRRFFLENFDAKRAPEYLKPILDSIVS